MHFTYENEINKMLPFLGVNIERNFNFATSVYRKPTFTGLYTKSNSFLPNRYKIGMIKTLIHRAYSLCSSFSLFHDEMKKLKNILVKNGFELCTIDRIIRKFLNDKFSTKVPIVSVNRAKIYIVLPYYGQFSLNIRNQLRRFLSSTYPQINFCFSFRTVKKLGQIFWVKDKLPNVLASNIIYKYKCDCCDAVYIGQTCRHFGIRRSEHIGISLKTGKSIAADKNSSIYHHYKITGHVPKMENFKIIDYAENQFHTHIKEALQINITKPSLNAQIDQPFLHLLQNWQEKISLYCILYYIICV